VTRLLARLLLLSRIVDRGYRYFDRLRSTVVLAAASDEFLDAYNAVAYSRTAAYVPGEAEFRRGLFEWERQAIARYFPRPPARVLIGGAGGGREPFALVEQGYEVVAFDPAEHLVAAMRGAAPQAMLQAYRGGYADLPRLRDAGDAVIDLAAGPPFDAAILGWSSFSHLRSDAERVYALRAVGALTNGPVLVSYFGDPSRGDAAPATGGGLKGWLQRRAMRRGRSVFSVQIGYYRVLKHAEVIEHARQAGLRVLGEAPDENFPYVILSRGDQAAEQ
jgi:hypothetical protein